MTHDFSLVFETDNEYWNRVLEIFEKNEKYPKKRVSNRNLHHKFPKSFSKMLSEPVDNDSDNLISLSLADHFLVHYYYYLLAKKGFKQRMATAFTFMAKKSLKYMTPETAEQIAKDYEEAKPISKKVWNEEELKIKSKQMKEYYETHPEYREAISPKGRKHSEETKQKMSESAKNAATPELCRFRSESKIGKAHPHKSGRKGKPISVFGKAFYAKYGILPTENNKLYRKELKFYKEHNTFSWLKDLENNETAT